ncbi:MAG: hypothetical protein JNK05_09970 [Myxococcales bacterium]|nr:hypothetical protein [Myxococcales bacterium]
MTVDDAQQVVAAIERARSAAGALGATGVRVEGDAGASASDEQAEQGASQTAESRARETS